MTVRFAVVGHPNKGKSSIVATLAERSDIAISATPGTTVNAGHYQLRIDDEVLYELIDTPGFQRARAVLAWLQEQAPSAEQRAAAVASFVASHRNALTFHDECELLDPIVAGAGIIYVVDGSHPYGAHYEAEMEILRWTGRPRLALINQTDPTQSAYLQEWQRALGQYFSVVRLFDAHHADFRKRLAILHTFAQLDELWQAPVQRAAELLEKHRNGQHRQAALASLNLLEQALTASITLERDPSQLPEAQSTALQNALDKQFDTLEQNNRTRIAAIYGHDALDLNTQLPSVTSLLDAPLLSEDVWLAFGLTRDALARAGAIAGAAGGVGIDLLVGGSSLFAGAGIGAALGWLGGRFGSESLASTQLAEQAVSKTSALSWLGLAPSAASQHMLSLGPVSHDNFPWVILGRTLLFIRLVAERNHARRDAIVLAAHEQSHYAAQIDDASRKVLSSLFPKLAKGNLQRAEREQILATLVKLIAQSDSAQDSEILQSPDQPQTDQTTGLS